MCYDNAAFVKWVSFKLVEFAVLPSIYVQIENERLADFKFIHSGSFSYYIKQEDVQYHTLKQGGFFGGEDIFFAIKKTTENIQKNKDDQKKNLKR